MRCIMPGSVVSAHRKCTLTFFCTTYIYGQRCSHPTSNTTAGNASSHTQKSHTCGLTKHVHTQIYDTHPLPPENFFTCARNCAWTKRNGLPKEPLNGSGSVSKTLIFRAGMFRGCVLRTFCFYYKKRFRCCVLQGFMRAPFFLKRVRAHKPS